MYNDYNNYARSKSRKSNAPIIILLLIFIMMVAVAGLFIYKYMTDKVDEYDKIILDYEILLEDYKLELDKLNADVLGLSGNLTDGLDDVDDLRDSLERVSSSTNNNRSINIVDTAARVSPSVIGVKVHVPAQNVNGFWRTRAVEAEGSGIILTEDGYIVTNYHVISYVDQYSNTVITVILSDGSEHIAKYIGGDELNDLAVLKIEADNLPYAALGLSDSSQVGDFVIAIGNPLGAYLSGSVTFGIISGLDRSIEAENVAEKLIQTDAAINPGNSGGALLNLNGEVIGINTIKVANSSGGTTIEGIGFAIPIDYAKPLIDSIIQHGYVKGRPTIGLSGSDISSSVSAIYGVPRGLLVEALDADGGAAASGIRTGDIITKIDEKNVLSMSDIADIIKTHQVGDTISATLWRDTSYQEVRIVLTEQK